MTNNDSSPTPRKRFLATGILLGLNILVFIDIADFDTLKEFEHTRKLSLSLPTNEKGEPAEDYKQSAPDEPGTDIQQISLQYFQKDKRRIFSIVLHVFDEEAAADLDAISSSIQISQ